VILDKHNRIIGTGYNGVPRGMRHCTDEPCAGVHAPKGSDLCEAVHAEQNALLQVRDPELINTVLVTHAPCMRCTKLLLNTSAAAIVFTDGSHIEPAAELLWRNAGRAWFNYRGET
jgi:dCMP deaminase